MQQNRRAFLKAGGLLAAMGVAGCTDGLLDQGDGGGGGGSRNWKYDPGTLATVGNKFFGDMAFGQIYDSREYLPESSKSSFEMGEDAPIDAEDIDKISGVGGAQISVESNSASVFGSAALLGSWEKSTMVSTMESEGEATEAGEYEGFTLYENAESAAGSVGMASQTSAMVAIGDDAMLIGASAAEQTSTDVTAEATVTTMIDAANGNATLLGDNSEYANRVSSVISANSMIVGGEVDPTLVELALQDMGRTEQQYVQGLRAGGFGASIEGETTTFTAAILYETATMAEETGLAELAEGLAPRLEEENEALDSLTAEYDDNAIVFEMSGPTRQIFEAGQDTAAGAAGTQLDVANPTGADVLPQ